MNNLVFFNGSPSEEALLRCTLVYNSIRTRVKRDDIVEKAIYATIALSSSALDLDLLQNLVFVNYHITLQTDELKTKIDSLRANKLIVHENYSAIRLSNDVSIESNLKEIETHSEKLVTDIYEMAENIYARYIPNKQIVKQYIRDAITYYLRETFLELFDLQEEKEVEQKENIIKTTLNGLGDKIGGATLRALSEILINPSEEHKLLLLEWSKAFLTLQIMDLDPKLNEFKQTKLSTKAFVVDTDVALHCLCSNTRLSSTYKLLVNKLKSMGCALYLPSLVIDEINEHINAAVKWGYSLGNQLLELPDETLEGGMISNAFIEDYVKTYRIKKKEGKKCIPFGVYIDNKRSKNDETVLLNNLNDVFGSENVKRQFSIISTDNEDVKKLTEAIHEQTLQTPKAEKRTDEENRKIALTDALLYITTKEMNKNIEGSKFFSNKTYILTSSSRTKRCAIEVDGYQKKIICHPRSLFAMLEEVGEINDNSISVVDILENPYLSYVAEQLWQQIDPILRQNQAIQFVTINKLKYDVNLRIDSILTSQNAHETAEILKKFGDDSLFGKDVLELHHQLEKERNENERLRDIIERQGKLLGKKNSRRAYYENRTKRK